MTDEQITQWQEAIKNTYMKVVIPLVEPTKGARLLVEIDDLIALARIGAAVQPRPISELVAVFDADGEAQPILIKGGAYGIWEEAKGDYKPSDWLDKKHWPTHFIEQSSLPQVKP